jgi:hypothetical protein
MRILWGIWGRRLFDGLVLNFYRRFCSRFQGLDGFITNIHYVWKGMVILACPHGKWHLQKWRLGNQDELKI